VCGVRIGEEGIGGFGGLPISAGLVDRGFWLGRDGLSQHQQAPIQARITQIEARELLYTPIRGAWYCTERHGGCHCWKWNAVPRDTGNSQIACRGLQMEQFFQLRAVVLQS